MSGETPIAVLPMYVYPWVAKANDALWGAIAARLSGMGLEPPATLTRGGNPAAQWRDPGLIFGQTCGYPYVTGLADAVTLIATPQYDFPGCEGATHRSFIVARADDKRRDLAEFRGVRAALNAWDSNTGMNLFRATIAPIAGGRSFFSTVVVTGSHEASLTAVADGQADLASIDCVSFALLQHGRPQLVERVAIVAEGPLSPGLPFIASARFSDSSVALIREALLAALANPDLSEARGALGLKGARVTTAADYQRVVDIEREAVSAGYPRLA